MAAQDAFDLVVIGGGPGGYTAARRAAELGLRTAVVDRCRRLGGTCLRVGCIPSKTLLSLTEAYAYARDRLSQDGINARQGFEIDLPRLYAYKDAVVAKLAEGVAFLMRQNGVRVIEGTARIAGPQSVAVRHAQGEEEILEARAVLLATGSEPIDLPFLRFDGRLVVGSSEALCFPEVPKTLLIIGAGAIGLELGSVWSRLGSEVTIVEQLPRIAAGFSPTGAGALQRELAKQRIRFLLAARVTGAEVGEARVKVRVEEGGREQDLVVDRVLVAVGRRPHHAGLALEEAGILLTERGRIRVNRFWQTSLPWVYAIGDLIEGPMLAHRAQAEGRAVAELLAGKPARVRYLCIPNVIYTEPEAAGVGFSEEDFRAAKRRYRRGTAYFPANGRALAADMPNGFVTVWMDEESGRFAGMEVLGSRASELIGAGAVALEAEVSVESLARAVPAHPSFMESVHEAAIAALRARPSGGF
ncbi:Dihydrolipoyl dehydrogenase [Methylacidimicrobium sp. AP8]|uniref:dihydrolipoyl dehydrogenase n=1 Tax=Methylacidimicrobium sp. AP8 TaxID=2730359 RepID=UPI0018C0135F|nr:dihydrolipoyl dehydrogenase [Methylacidimicrobium sp. AP8]CAB4244565.1 Dihydrolipoyl dehydrogenase [Methylacidimicrobium sp. AP8]